MVYGHLFPWPLLAPPREIHCWWKKGQKISVNTGTEKIEVEAWVSSTVSAALLPRPVAM